MHLANRSDVLDTAAHPPAARALPGSTDARRAKKLRATARIDEALRRCPDLRTDRVGPIREILRFYHAQGSGPSVGNSPLARYSQAVGLELADLEGYVGQLPKASYREGAAIRRALCFLRGFTKISALDFDLVPIEERELLIELLRLEYRWCFAAAGTTPRAFKIAIGRTGAR